MRTIACCLTLVIFLSACVPAPLVEAPDLQADCQNWTTALEAIRPLDMPDYLMQDGLKRGGEFDPNVYFTVLQELAMTKGETLDYVYELQVPNGMPRLYGRPINQAPYHDFDQLPATYQPHEYLEHIQVTDNPQGFLQFAILSIKADQFYLFGHAGYHDEKILCDRQALEEAIQAYSNNPHMEQLSPEAQERAQKIDITPVVTMERDTVTISLIFFSKWGGFIRYTLTISRSFPHRLIDISEETLVQYNCGIFF